MFLTSRAASTAGVVALISNWLSASVKHTAAPRTAGPTLVVPTLCGLMSLAMLAALDARAQEPAARSGTTNAAGAKSAANATKLKVTTTEFVYETAPFPQCHASTIVDTPTGLVCAFFAGTREKHPDVGVWVSRLEAGKWTAPVEVANGVESPEKRHPCWNPVLFQPENGPLLLFYKVGPSPDTWWGMLITSTDGGKTWSKPRKLPDDIAGPIKNKPVMLADGRLLCGSSTEDNGWRVHMEWTKDLGQTWERTPPLNEGKTIGAIQPTILKLADGKLKMLCRSRGPGKILASTSSDQGRTWSPLSEVDLPNPNSGIDAVTLKDGRHLLVYNHTPKGRSPLNVALSTDGETWSPAAVLETEPGEYSYPAIVQSRDGKVHITYTWKRTKVRHVVAELE
ncbi:MAG TPA: exo-alpha-sialidase [Pirellulaceae bacterium]|nr:exo-alpha-sialidase [Pirellulaceae bacterium]